MIARHFDAARQPLAGLWRSSEPLHSVNRIPQGADRRLLSLHSLTRIPQVASRRFPKCQLNESLLEPLNLVAHALERERLGADGGLQLLHAIVKRDAVLFHPLPLGLNW
jgi:hypothetical protein